MLRRVIPSAIVASCALLTLSGPAFAHIDPDPDQAQAGARLTVGFTVEHGCEGSPTVQLDMRLPEGVSDAATEPLDGWEGSVADVDGDAIVTFVGGPLADDVEGTFSVTMTLPPTPDETIYFPFVQRCEIGEIRWIGIPAEPGEELDEPAPAMLLTGPVAAPVAPVTTSPASAPATTPETTVASATTEPTPPATDGPSTTDPVTSDGPADDDTPTSSEPAVVATDDEGFDSGAGTMVFIASIAAVVGLGVYVAFRSRQARAAAAREGR